MQPTYDLLEPLTRSVNPATLSMLSKKHRDASIPFYNRLVGETRSMCKEPVTLEEVESLDVDFVAAVISKDMWHTFLIYFMTADGHGSGIVAFVLRSTTPSYDLDSITTFDDIRRTFDIIRFDLSTVKRVLIDVRGCPRGYVQGLILDDLYAAEKNLHGYYDKTNVRDFDAGEDEFFREYVLSSLYMSRLETNAAMGLDDAILTIKSAIVEDRL